MFNLTNKLAVVTGASGSIGTAIATSLHKAGARLLLTGRNEEKLAPLATRLKGEYLALDLSDEAATTTLAQKAEQLGGATILVNNAGWTKDTLALRLKRQDLDQVLRVNFTATFSLSKAMLSQMLKAKEGRIINITSIIGSVGNAGQVAYAASKAAIAGMSRSLAKEVASRNITVNCVAPGFIETPMTQDLDTTKMLEQIPAKRLGTPEDVAATVTFLASEEASYITGATIHINGGMAMF